MKEDIEYLQRFINRCKKSGSEFYGILKPGHFESLQNLINKYKEQEKEIQGNHILLAKYSKKIEEQQQVIELMAKELAVCGGFDYVEFGMSTGDFNKDIKNMIDYFKKKARDENEI